MRIRYKEEDYRETQLPMHGYICGLCFGLSGGEPAVEFWTVWEVLCQNEESAMSDMESVFSKNPEWREVKQTLKAIHRKGWEALLAGGGVRDALLGRSPKDFDVATSARPEEILRLFPRGKGIWKKYGVVFLPLSESGGNLEITTFRKERSYRDGRRPGVVEYTSSPEEDAKRRDFTVNALFYDVRAGKVLDFVGGMEDLKACILRAVGDPETRFQEDHLRPLRALRFAHRLGFDMDPETARAVPLFANRLKKISRERIQDELLKLFSVGPLDRAVKILKEYSFCEVALPFGGKKPFGPPDLFWKQPFSFLKEPAFMWSALGLPFFFLSPEELKNFLLSLKSPLSVSSKSLLYVKNVKTLLSSDSLAEKIRAFSSEGERVRELAQNFVKAYDLSVSVEDLFREFQVRCSNGKLPPPLVTGRDLLKTGSPAGREMGEALKRIYDYQLENNISRKEDIPKRLLD